MRAFLLFAAVCGALFCTAPREIKAEEIWLLAAASLMDVATDVISAYQTQSNDTVISSFAGSAALAQQIKNGAPADIFVSANLAWMDVLINNNLVKLETRKNTLGNRLVLITHVDNNIEINIEPDFPLAKTLGNNRLAIANPDFVPAGEYATASLEWLGVWPEVANKLAPGNDVRNTLLLVERGESSLGIVYQTDVVASQHVRIVDRFPLESHPPIIYSFGVVKNRDVPAVMSFYNFLTGPKAMEIFKNYGFATR